MQADTAMPTQSAPQVSQTPQSSYAAPAQTAAQAPSVATTNQWVAPYQQAAAPAPQMQAQMGIPQAPVSTPTQYAPQTSQAAPQQENPYRDAFNKVVGLLSSPVQFPSLGQQSSQTQTIDPASYSSQQAPQFSSLGMQTSSPSINNNQAFSNDSSQTSLEITPEQLLANGVSHEGLEIHDHFGPDAAKVLNDYACQVEDALIQTNAQLVEACNLLQELSGEHRAYEQILTDPDTLADYTCEFFGENGPYPIPEEQVQPQGMNVGQQFQQQQFQQPAAPQQVAPQRPQMPVPPQPQAAANPGDFWNSFGNLADRDPANAWRYLNSAQQTPEVFRNKLLVME